MYRKILMTHDGSELASEAVAHVVELARLGQSEVLLLRVTDTPGQTLTRLGGGWAAAGEVAAEAAVEETQRHDTEAVAQLSALREQLHARGVERVSIEVVEGAPGPAIIEVAAQQGCDLIVMATHGRSGLGRAVLGSVADHVIRHSSIPVLLVRPASA
ncbi:MAG: universal stress protein [Dehalococcoidia bacterium]